MSDVLNLNNGFVWFVGTVVDVMDPLQIGRIKVRALPFYKKAADDDLPWAQCMQPVQSAAQNGVGLSPTGIQSGSVVIGFFLDGELAQQPMVLGTFAGTGDVHGLAREENTINKSLYYTEPESSYAAAYPFNKTITTSSGHVIELDDTDGAERIHVYHKKGTFVEMRPDGSVIYKAVDDRYDITVGNHNLYVKENLMGQVDGLVDIRVRGNVNVYTANTAKVTADTKIILASPLIEINGADDIDFVNNEGGSDGNEPLDNDGADQENFIMEGGTLVSSPGGTSGGVAQTVEPNPENTPARCERWSSDDQAIRRLSDNVDVASFRHGIPSQKSWASRRRRIPRTSLDADNIVCNLGYLWDNVVSPVLARYPTLRVNSGYRTGSGGSLHDAGMAVDLQVPTPTDNTLRALATMPIINWMVQNVPFDQLALEYSPTGSGTTWIHCSCIRPNAIRGLTNLNQVTIWNATTTSPVRLENERFIPR